MQRWGLEVPSVNTVIGTCALKKPVTVAKRDVQDSLFEGVMGVSASPNRTHRPYLLRKLAEGNSSKSFL